VQKEWEHLYGSHKAALGRLPVLAEAVGKLPVAAVVTADVSEAAIVAVEVAAAAAVVVRFTAAAICVAFDGNATSTFPDYNIQELFEVVRADRGALPRTLARYVIGRVF
jgi:hypothetical protein